MYNICQQILLQKMFSMTLYFFLYPPSVIAPKLQMYSVNNLKGQCKKRYKFTHGQTLSCFNFPLSYFQAALKDFSIHFGLPLNHCQGQCYDGASLLF